MITAPAWTRTFCGSSCGSGIHARQWMDAGNELAGGGGKMADHHREGERRVIHGNERSARRPAGFPARHDHRRRLGLHKLAVIFLVAQKADVTGPGRVEGGHPGDRQIEPAPDDVTIDPAGELGKREGECQRGNRLDYLLSPVAGAAGSSGLGSPSVGSEPAGASLLRFLSKPAVMSVASLV